MAIVCVMWQATCDLCGEASPEARESMEQAQRDLDECPCRFEDAE